MNSNSLVEIFCDANNKIGYGHIRRSLTLASRLEKDGLNIRLTGLSTDASNLLPESRFQELEPKIVIFDSPSNINKYILTARKKKQIIITLDWFGEVESDFNIVIYPHKKVTALQKSFVGFEFILLREDIIELSSLKMHASSNNVLIFLGGGDILQQGHSAAGFLTKLGYNVTLIEGHFSKKTRISHEYKVLVTPPEFPKILLQSDWVITNGGNCLFEAVFLGKAAYVLPQTEAEFRIASSFYENGAVLGIGINGMRNFNHHEIDQVHRNCLGLVDGNGAKRISEIVRGLL